MNNIKKALFAIFFLIFPLFFLPFSQEYFITAKLYLLGFFVLVLLVLSATSLFIDKKISWKRSAFDMGLSLFLIAEILSLLVVTPNKIQALLDPNLGFVALFSLIVFYFFLSQSVGKKQLNQYLILLQWSGLIVAIISIIFFFNPFKNISLPVQLQFFKYPTFSPLGSQLDLAAFLGFLLVFQIGKLLGKKKVSDSFSLFSLVVIGLGIVIAIYNMLHPSSSTPSQTLFPPYRTSWYAAVEILKHPLSAIFGVGIGNFASIFTQVKDLTYNQSSLWQINSFSISHSLLLQVLTETGLLGFIALATVALTIWKVFKKIPSDNQSKPMFLFPLVYLLLLFLLLPPSFIVLFLFMVMLVFIAIETQEHSPTYQQELDLSYLIPVYLGLGLIIIAFVFISGYLLSRAYAAEYAYKQSLNGYLENNLADVYNNQRNATSLNPYVERFHIAFSQANLLVANNISAQVKPAKDDKGPQLTDQQKQTIVQAIQAAINEAKAAVILNPQNAGNWENLAAIYRNILNAVQGADVWTISSYQRAIQLDPLNPVYRLNLGGVYYSLQQYSNAVNLFDQTVSLKADWANAHYNLAWASYQAKDYQKAATEMQNVVKLLDKKQNPSDYKRAQQELELFKNKIPQEQSQSTPEAQPGALQLPQSPQTQISPKLQLPNTASPEAK